jgi:protein tyrosine phosphatase (PTP) superfamily phosphohydrolase (DUF442 family)
MSLRLLVLAACLTAPLLGCGRSEVSSLAAPMVLDGTAYEAALTVSLDDAQLEELPGLHNVLRLSDQVISGGEPEGPESMAAIAGMGVKTILSVDGKTPDARSAEALGMRYVHVPIQYRGITDDELLQITKTFRELEGPFYVHCFHGQHRGPAAAAVGRVVLDGVAREQALAEMRQWCGTSGKYEGLYGVVAVGDIPSAAQTSAYAFEFPATRPLDGVAGLMVGVSRAYDRILSMKRNAWQVNPDHPDIDPVNESAIVASLFTQALELPDVHAQSDDYRALMQGSIERARALRSVVADVRDSEQPDWQPAEDAFADLKASCDACHVAHRN